MPAPNKIIKYQVGDRCRALSANGHSHDEISDIVNRELAGIGSISPAAVGRFLKKDREERASETNKVIGEFIRETLPADLKLLNDMGGDYLGLRNKEIAKVTGKVTEISGGDKIDFSLKTLKEIDLMILEITKIKLRFLGGGGDDDERRHPVDLSQFRNEYNELQKAVGDGVNHD